LIKILTHYTPSFKDIATISVPNFAEYCDRHGYELVVKEVPDYEKYNGLNKLGLYLFLREGDTGVFIDCDCLITNMTMKIEPLLWVKRDLYFSRNLNCGVFIARKTTFNDDLINHVITHVQNGYYNCEQDAFEDLIGDRQEDHHFVICDHPSFNSFIPELYGHIEHPEEITPENGRWEPGQFICHLPSLGMETRLEKMKELKEKIVR